MSAEVGHIDWLGFIIFAIVMGSLFSIVLAAALGKPRKPKVTLTVIGTLLALLAIVVAGVWVGGLIFSALMG